MADIVDTANDLVALSEELALREIRAKKPDAVYIGACLFCDEPLEAPKRWCDVEHRDRWELERKRK
jgi:hypothetical protein